MSKEPFSLKYRVERDAGEPATHFPEKLASRPKKVIRRIHRVSKQGSIRIEEFIQIEQGKTETLERDVR